MLIEEKIGVSSEWLLGEPELSHPILGIDGKPWAPEKYLDFLGKAAGGVDWRLLMSNSPIDTVKLASGIVEVKLKDDLISRSIEGDTPSHRFLTDLVELLDRHGCFDDKEILELIAEATIQDLNQTMKKLVTSHKNRK